MQAHTKQPYGEFPLSFEANQGQADARAHFIARGSRYSLFLTAAEAVLVLHKLPVTRTRIARSAEGVALRLRWLGADRLARIIGQEPLASRSHYFIGNDPQQWHVNVPHYTRVRYRSIYPGIDLVYYGNHGQLEYDLILAAGADPRLIKLQIAGVEGLELGSEGELLLHAQGGALIHYKPFVYQPTDEGRAQVGGGYVLLGEQEVGIVLAEYDTTRPLVIDPVLSYSTYLGGDGGEFGRGISVDREGSAYVSGVTLSTNFPTTVGAFQVRLDSGVDAFVTKLNATGTALVYSTYLGGSKSDSSSALTLDFLGNAYVTGYTDSSDFPVTPGAYQSSIRGKQADAFVVKLNPAGNALLYSTYLGGSDYDYGYGIAVDNSGHAYVTGLSASADFPTTPGGYQDTLSGNNNAFVAKLNSAGTALVYSTYLGGSNYDYGYGITVDSSDHAFITGLTFSKDFPTTPGAFQPELRGVNDGFVVKLNTTGSRLLYSTHLGGSKGEFGRAIAVDKQGNAYVTGPTDSVDFPTTEGAYQTTLSGSSDAFVTKLNPTGSDLLYSTYLGGSDLDESFGITVDLEGNAFVTGPTDSADFPVTSGALQGVGGGRDVFVAKLNLTGHRLLYSTYLGGSGTDASSDVAVDNEGSVYVTGSTDSADFPATPGAPQTAIAAGSGEFATSDAFIAKISEQKSS